MTGPQDDPYAAFARPVGGDATRAPDTSLTPQPADPYAGIGKALTDPLPEGITPRSSSERAAGYGDIVGASFIDNPESRARYFSLKRGVPLDRYRVMDNDVVYQADDGNWYKEVPDPGLADFLKDPEAVAKRIAGGVGPSVPAVAGTAAGILTAPAVLAGPPGMVGSIAATGGAAAAGEVAKDAIGSYLSGESQMDWQSPVKEGAIAAAGQGVGAGLTALGNRYAVQDVAQLNRPAASALQQKAEAQGIPLTAAEVSQLRSLKGQQTLLGNIPRSGEIMDDFYRGRAPKVEDAITRYLGQVSPQDSPELAGAAIRDAAEAAITAAKDARSAAAKPFYDAARASKVAVDPTSAVQFIDDALNSAKGSIRSTLEKARGALYVKPPPGSPPGTKPTIDTTVEGLHQSKMAIDSLIEQAKRNGDDWSVRNLVEVQRRLVQSIEDAAPDYAMGRTTFAAASPAVDDLQSGLVGMVAKIKDGKLKDAASVLLNPKSAGPRAVMNARVALEKADPAAWQGIKRAYLQDLWQSVKDPRALQDAAPDLGGARWSKVLMGDEQQRGILRSALTPTEYRALNDLSEVLDATASVIRRNSHTAYQTEALQNLKAEARGAVMGTARAVVNPISSVREWIDQAMLGKHAAKLAEIATSPDAVKQLRALRVLSPNSAKFRAGVGQFLTTWGMPELADALIGGDATPRTVPPRPQ